MLFEPATQLRIAACQLAGLRELGLFDVTIAGPLGQQDLLGFFGVHDVFPSTLAGSGERLRTSSRS